MERKSKKDIGFIVYTFKYIYIQNRENNDKSRRMYVQFFFLSLLLLLFARRGATRVKVVVQAVRPALREKEAKSDGKRLSLARLCTDIYAHASG